MYQYFTLTNTQVRVTSTVVELYDTQRQLWIPMIPNNSSMSIEQDSQNSFIDAMSLEFSPLPQSNNNNNKRKLESLDDNHTSIVEAYDSQPSLKRKRVSWSSLCTDIILYILCFQAIHVLHLDELPALSDFFGRFTDNTIHSLYLNVQIDDMSVGVSEMMDLSIYIHQCRILELNCGIPNELIKYLHIVSPMCNQFSFWCSTEDDDIIPITNIIDKVVYVRLRENELHYVQLLKNVKTLWLEKFSDSRVDIGSLIMSCKCLNLNFYELELSGDFPLDKVHANSRIQRLEVYSDTMCEYNFNQNQLANVPNLKSFCCNMDIRLLHTLLHRNKQLEKIALYHLTKSILDLLRTLPNLQSMELYVTRADIDNVKRIPEYCTHLTKLDLYHASPDDIELAYSMDDVVALADAFQKYPHIKLFE
jgi:hypothetical protein